MRVYNRVRVMILGLLVVAMVVLPASASAVVSDVPSPGDEGSTTDVETPEGVEGAESSLRSVAYDVAGSAEDAQQVDPDRWTTEPEPGLRTSADSGKPSVTATDSSDAVALTPPAAGAGRSLDGHAVLFEGETDSSAVMVEKTNTDIADVAGAVRMHVLIADASAPTRYDFDLDLPAGARLQLDQDGGARAVDSEERTLGLFAPPWAVDGAGDPVPTRYLVEGNTLVQEVLHEGATYPVVADPWWFVPVFVAGSRVVMKISVRAKNASAARAAATRKAVSRGARVRQVGAPVKGNFFTAAGHQIRVGGRFNPRNGYDSFAAFKRAHPGRKGYEWHHIVEQSNVGRFGSRMINNKQNLILIAAGLHRGCINRFMNTALGNLTRAELQALRVTIGPDQGNWTLRQALTGYSLRNFHLVGLRLLSLCGVKIQGSGV